MQRLRQLSEAECYARCYGHRVGVRVVKLDTWRVAEAVPEHEEGVTQSVALEPEANAA
jgi:hypothetical protein